MSKEIRDRLLKWAGRVVLCTAVSHDPSAFLFLKFNAVPYVYLR
jgi:hypothetical protein